MTTVTVCYTEDSDRHSAIYIDGVYRGIYKDFDELPCSSTRALLKELGVIVEWKEVETLPDEDRTTKGAIRAQFTPTGNVE